MLPKQSITNYTLIEEGEALLVTNMILKNLWNTTDDKNIFIRDIYLLNQDFIDIVQNSCLLNPVPFDKFRTLFYSVMFQDGFDKNKLLELINHVKRIYNQDEINSIFYIAFNKVVKAYFKHEIPETNFLLYVAKYLIFYFRDWLALQQKYQECSLLEDWYDDDFYYGQPDLDYDSEKLTYYTGHLVFYSSDKSLMSRLHRQLLFEKASGRPILSAIKDKFGEDDNLLVANVHTKFQRFIKKLSRIIGVT